MAQPQRASRHRKTVHREAPVIDVSSRRAAEESAWRIKSVKLERDRHAQQRHLNPLNMADTIGKLVDSFKGRHRDAILVIGEDTLEVFVESPEAAAPTKKLRKGLSKVFGRKDSDSDAETECIDGASGVGDTEEALDGHLFSVGVAFAQILQLSQHDKAITIYYHPNSFSSTQSIRSNLANCWRFTVALDTPEEADSVMADIKLQLARYAQGIHWVQKNFLLDEAISALLVTAGPMSLPGGGRSNQASHTVLQMQPDFDVPFPAPESWNQQAVKGEAGDIVRVFLQTPTGCCHVDITRAVLHRHIQGDQGHFYVNATAVSGSKEISLEALQKRNMEINKYLVQGTRSHRLSLSRAGSTATESQMDDTSVAPTPRDMSPSPTPRTLSLSGTHTLALDSSAASEASNSDLSYQRSPRAAGKPRGGFGFSDRPLLGGEAEDPVARSRSFTGQDLRQKPSNLSVASGRDMADEESTQAMRRVSSWSSMSGSPRKSKAGTALSIQAHTDPSLQPDAVCALDADTDRDMAPPKRLGSVRFAQPTSPDSPADPSPIGQPGSPRAGSSMPITPLQVRLHCRAQRVTRRSASPPPVDSGFQGQSSSQLKPLTQLAAQQPQVLNDIVSQPAVWIAYTPLTFILLLLLTLLRIPFWSSLLGSAVSTAICVLYAAQQRLLLGRQEQIAVLRTRKAVAGGLADQQEAPQADRPLPTTQILLTLLGAEITDSVSAEGTDDTYDDGSGSELSLEVGAEAGSKFEAQAQAQQQQHAAATAQSGPATATGALAEVPAHQSMLRRFSKDHAISEDIQKRFMIAVENNDEAAKTRVQDWLEWKNKNALANCLHTPQPHYDIMKKCILHGVVCMSKSDHPIRIMKVGDMRAAWKKMKAAGITSDMGLRHFGFVEEYMWQVVDPRPLPLGTAIWIVDLGGMGLSDLGSDAFQFFKRMSVEVGMHYPERLYKLVLLNAPSFFSLLWRICEPIMPGTTRNKVKVVRSHQELVTALADECDQCAIPSDYGGTCPTPLYESQLERELRDFVRNLGQ
ncbi:hypothetical protein ABBQ38_009981 [Trebouxia sp. C0009 RCD-2024]